MKMSPPFAGWVGLTAVLLTVAIGCKNDSALPTARLQGTVTINGQPIPAGAQGSIIFSPTEITQAPSASAEIIDGKFDVPDAPTGKVTVSFSIQEVSAANQDRSAEPVPPKNLVPPGKGQISLDVTGNKSDLTFDLK